MIHKLYKYLFDLKTIYRYIFINICIYIYIHSCTYIQSVNTTLFLLFFLSSMAEFTSIYIYNVSETCSDQLMVDWFGAQLVLDSKGIK